MSDSQPSFDLYTFVILLFASAVAAATAGLTYWAEMSVPLALLAGGAAGSTSMLWAIKVFKRP
ncbi:hypothetical protein [Spirillospora sp. NPDC048823]|uniref:hypothetical protein n=1 Tax=unclassified Spirillospora TaxID=2642701 RepID=UPI003715DE9D